MKTLFRMVAVVTAAVVSVVSAQRLFRKLYTDFGTKYVVVEEELKGA